MSDFERWNAGPPEDKDERLQGIIDSCKGCPKLLEKPACLEALYSYNCIREDPHKREGKKY